MRMPYDVCASWIEPVIAAAAEGTRLIGGSLPPEVVPIS
jgi:hypothetical protein